VHGETVRACSIAGASCRSTGQIFASKYLIRSLARHMVELAAAKAKPAERREDVSALIYHQESADYFATVPLLPRLSSRSC
ncbi:MAG: hypothetical protein WCA91_17270, partial [Candidatus Acidiferrales bacterium]